VLKQIKYNLSSSAGFFLLLVYAFASYGSLFQSHETTNHIHEHGHEISLEDHILLSSACHNSIYHNTESECGHNEHFSKTDEKCFSCEFYISKEAIATQEIYPSVFPVISTIKADAYCFFHSKDLSLLKPNRGPPVFVI
jgi:hypothetical protein